MTRREFEVTEPEKIIEILEKCKVIHVGLVDDGMPYIVPMNYGYAMEDGKLTLYLHSAPKCYKLDVIEKNPVCCFEMECDVAPFEGEMACQNGMTYSSLMGRGKVSVIEKGEDKIEAMKALMKVQTGRDFDFTERLLSIVTMLKIEVSDYSAKHRPVPKDHRKNK